MKTLIIGANGQIGKLLCQHCALAKIPVIAMIRKSEQAPFFENLGLETVIADLEGDFIHAMEGCDRVVFTAGSGGHTGADKTLLIDLYGAIRSIDACESQGVREYLMVSALRADNPLNGPEKIRHYLVAKKLADEHLMRSSLHYTILRPGRLVNDPATGKIRSQRGNNPAITVSRENVALCLLACLQQTTLPHGVIDLLDGDIPIQEFIKSLN